MTGRCHTWMELCGAVFLVIAFLKVTPVRSEFRHDTKERIKVFVSILPQAYFVKRVGGERVDVSVMVGPGHSPATYEPVPKQMAELSKAKLYFRIGVPFEDVWMGRISKANPNMKVIDTRRGVVLLPMKSHYHAGGEADHNHVGYRAERHREGLKDPHIWLSLRLSKILAQNVYDALISEDPFHQPFYQDNLRAFHHDLDALDAEITEIMKNTSARQFMVFHPAWGYFAHDYGLEQKPIEIEGKRPTAKDLAHIVEEAREAGIKIIFVQKQFSVNHAETVAHAIGGRVIQIDPLAEDYLENMRKIAHTFAEVLQ